MPQISNKPSVAQSICQVKLLSFPAARRRPASLYYIFNRSTRFEIDRLRDYRKKHQQLICRVPNIQSQRSEKFGKKLRGKGGPPRADARDSQRAQFWHQQTFAQDETPHTYIKRIGPKKFFHNARLNFIPTYLT